MIGRKRRTAKIDSLIGQNTIIQGDVLFSGGLHIDGAVKGNIVSTAANSQLTVSEHGLVEGEIRVSNVMLNGRVEGDIHTSERIELASEARVNGTVYYHLIEMAIGAEVNGRLVHCDVVEEDDSQLIELKEERSLGVD